MNEYIYLRAWCWMLGSFSTFTENEVVRAKADKAPQTAVYRRSNGTWATFEEIQCKKTKQAVQAIVEEMKSHSGLNVQAGGPLTAGYEEIDNE